MATCRTSTPPTPRTNCSPWSPGQSLPQTAAICEPPEWIAHNALTVDEALHLMTTGAAYALDRDEEVGSLVAGKFADLIILTANPQTIPPTELKDLKVLMTMVGGKIEYCAGAMKSLCPSTSPRAGGTTGWIDHFPR